MIRRLTLLPTLLAITLFILDLLLLYRVGHRPTSAANFTLLFALAGTHLLFLFITLPAIIYLFTKRRPRHALVLLAACILLALPFITSLGQSLQDRGQQRFVAEIDLPATVRETIPLLKFPPKDFPPYRPTTPRLHHLTGDGHLTVSNDDENNPELIIIFNHEPAFRIRHNPTTHQWQLLESQTPLLTAPDTNLSPPTTTRP